MDNLTNELNGYNLYTTDLALQEGVRRAGAGAHEAELATYGAALGSAATIRMAEEPITSSPNCTLSTARAAASTASSSTRPGTA